MIFERLFSLESRRKRLLARTPQGPVHDFLNTPFVPPRQDCRHTDYIALDLETTGLDPQRDTILSFGYVGMHGTRIDLATARHRIIQTQKSLPEQSVVIHQLTDDTVARGEPLITVLSEFLRVLAGKVMIAHHAKVELSFIAAACRKLFDSEFLVPTVDTQYIAKRSLERRNIAYAANELRLFNLRERYNLPHYQAHNALSDAIAAGELFAAQVEEQGACRTLPLKQFLLGL